MKCKHCEQETNLESHAYANHVRWCDLNPRKAEYLDRLSKAREKRNLQPASNQYIKASQEGRKVEISEKTREKLSKAWTGQVHTEETKKLLSEKRRKWLQDNPELHPWKRSSKFISAPCEVLKQRLRDEGIEFEEECTAVPGRFFSIDIAITAKKIGIEVNGEQHYKRTGELKDYYQARHDLIESLGWTLIELHYTECYNEDAVGAMVKRIS